MFEQTENARLAEAEERMCRERRVRAGIEPANPHMRIAEDNRTAAEKHKDAQLAEEQKTAEVARINAESIARAQAARDKAAAITKRLEAEAIAEYDRRSRSNTRSPEDEAAERERNLTLSRTQGFCGVCRRTVELIDGKMPQSHSYRTIDSQTHLWEERTCYPYGEMPTGFGPHPAFRNI
jgi:hypothetical protein